MQRFIAAAAIICLAVVLSHGQQQKDELDLRGNVSDVELFELIRLTANHKGMTFLYNPHQVSAKVSVIAPDAGARIEPESMDLFLQNALEQMRLCFVPDSDLLWTIVPTAEARTRAPRVSEADLARANPAHWVSVTVQLNHADANQVMSTVRNLMSTHGGLVHPIAGSNSLVMVDRVDRLRETVALIREIEDARRPMAVKYALPEGVTVAAALRSLQAFLPGMQVVHLPDTDSLFAHGTTAEHEQVAQILAALAE